MADCVTPAFAHCTDCHPAYTKACWYVIAQYPSDYKLTAFFNVGSVDRDYFSSLSRGSYSAVVSCLVQNFLHAVLMTNTPSWGRHICPQYHTRTCIPHTHILTHTHALARPNRLWYSGSISQIISPHRAQIHFPHVIFHIRQGHLQLIHTLPLTSALDLELKQFHSGWIFHGAHNAPCPEGDRRAVIN